MFDASKINEAVDVVDLVGGASLYSGTGRLAVIGGAERYTGSDQTDGKDHVDFRGGADLFYQNQLDADDQDANNNATTNEDQDWEALSQVKDPKLTRDLANVSEARFSASKILAGLSAIAESYIPHTPMGWDQPDLSPDSLTSEGSETDTPVKLTLGRALRECALIIGATFNVDDLTATVDSDGDFFKLFSALGSKQGFINGFVGASIKVTTPTAVKVITFGTNGSITISE